MLLRAALGPKFSVGMVGPNKELGGWGSVLFAYSGLVDCLDGFFGNCWVDGLDGCGTVGLSQVFGPTYSRMHLCLSSLAARME